MAGVGAVVASSRVGLRRRHPDKDMKTKYHNYRKTHNIDQNMSCAHRKSLHGTSKKITMLTRQSC